MAKSSKKSKETAAPEINPVAPDKEARNGNGLAKAAKPAAAKSPSVKVAKSASRPKSAGKTRGAKPRKTPAAPEAPDRGYFEAKSGSGQRHDFPRRNSDARLLLAERRMREENRGNSADDWLEARRQLLVEAGQAA